MTASYLILFVLWTTPPETVFADACVFQGHSVCGRELISDTAAFNLNPALKVSSPTSMDESQPGVTVRGQILQESNDSLSTIVPPASCCDHVLVREFFTGMNPFVEEEFRTLEGYYDPYGSQASYGTAGVQPFRLGWISYNDIMVIPFAPTTGTSGEMKVVEWNSNVRVAHVVAPGVLFNGTGYFNARWWDGPGGTPLPGQVDQISTDIEFGFFNDGPWSGQVAFHPQIVESYEAHLNRYAFNFDGRAIAMYRASPNWSFVGGIGFWDRVDLLVVPHVGVIWSPNERWEFRLLFPKSRASYYLGRWRDADFWFYGEAEYHVEAWQSTTSDPRTHDRIQISDERFDLGLRWDKGRYSFFVDGGYVFDRRAKFAGSTPGFDIGSMGTVRVGLRY